MIRARPFAHRLLVPLVVALLTTSACAGSSTKEDSSAKSPKVTAGSKVIPPASTSRSTPSTSGGSGPQTTAAVVPAATGSKVAAPGAYAVGTLEKTYIDRTRKTKMNGTAAEKPERTLPALVLYPAQGTPGFETSQLNAEPKSGPWPLVVFSHGVTGTGHAYATTLRVFASAGYVVIAPDYPLSKAGAEGNPTITDVAEQTRDIRFLIDQMLAATKATSTPLSGMIDPDRIGIAGHSLGAITSLGAGFNACCTDPRIRAVAEWAGVFFPLESEGKVAPGSKGRPLLILHGDQDQTVRYPAGNAVYALLGPPKYFVTLPGAGHILPYIRGVGSPQSKVVTLTTIDFFDRYLKGDKTGIGRLHKVVTDAGRANATEQEDPS